MSRCGLCVKRRDSPGPALVAKPGINMFRHVTRRPLARPRMRPGKATMPRHGQPVKTRPENIRNDAAFHAALCGYVKVMYMSTATASIQISARASEAHSNAGIITPASFPAANTVVTATAARPT